jgi:hypothetical protein
MEILKRSEVKEKLEQKLKDFYHVPSDSFPLVVEMILSELEDLKLLDKSQFGSVCSRCKKTSWQSES